MIEKLKAHFARHGIPDVVISDNGPQFTSQQFRKFSNDWEFEHRTSSPYHSQANGAAEATVKIAKRILSKSKQRKEDPIIELLKLRSTPMEGVEKMPAQLLMGRRTKNLIPATLKTLQPEGIIQSEEIYPLNKQIQTKTIQTQIIYRLSG